MGTDNGGFIANEPTWAPADGTPVAVGTGSHGRVQAMDTRTPHPARMYDYYLGGKDNFPADRRAAEEVLKVFPEARQLARANRQFLVRAVGYCAEAGIEQFLDVGTGIPTSPNVPEVAREVQLGARVVGVDNDPIVLAHDRALVESSNDEIRILPGDLRRPWEFLDDPELREILDLTRPIAVALVPADAAPNEETMPALRLGEGLPCVQVRYWRLPDVDESRPFFVWFDAVKRYSADDARPTTTAPAGVRRGE